MYRILYTQSYETRAARFLKKHPDVQNQYTKTLQLLELNPYHPSLRLHKFKTSSFEGYSVSINLTYRISLEFLVEAEEIIPVNIGDHQDIYGR
ncbi:MAG: plasmid stabilization protein [Spirochaetales bacterium]|nr:plasmid stabilization protein [Spirochaetales bacterium]